MFEILEGGEEVGGPEYDSLMGSFGLMCRHEPGCGSGVR